MAFPPPPRSKGGVEATRVQQEGLGIAARGTNSQPMEGVLREKVEATSCQQVAGVSLREVLATSPGLVGTFPRTPRTKEGVEATRVETKVLGIAPLWHGLGPWPYHGGVRGGRDTPLAKHSQLRYRSALVWIGTWPYHGGVRGGSDTPLAKHLQLRYRSALAWIGPMAVAWGSARG